MVRRGQPQHALVAELAHRLGGSPVGPVGGDGLTGVVDGSKFTLRYKSSVAGNHTTIAVAMPAAYPLAIFVSRQGPREASHGLVDGPFGDAELDDRFLVEAAPVAVVRQLLDADARRFFAELEDCRLATRGHELVLTLPTWISPATAVRVLHGLVAVVARIRDAFALVNPMLQVAGEPFREMPRARDEARDQADQRAEVRRLFARHGAVDSQRRIYVMLFIAMVIVSVMITVGIGLARS